MLISAFINAHIRTNNCLTSRIPLQRADRPVWLDPFSIFFVGGSGLRDYPLNILFQVSFLLFHSLISLCSLSTLFVMSLRYSLSLTCPMNMTDFCMTKPLSILSCLSLLFSKRMFQRSLCFHGEFHTFYISSAIWFVTVPTMYSWLSNRFLR